MYYGVLLASTLYSLKRALQPKAVVACDCELLIKKLFDVILLLLLYPLGFIVDYSQGVVDNRFCFLKD